MIEFENSIWHHYHSSSRDKAKGHPPIPYNANEWPDSWKEVQYKSYDRLPKITLPPPSAELTSLAKALETRKSSRDFEEKPLSLQQISDIFFWSCSTEASEGQRPYPSGGGRFPVEMYVVNLRDTEGLSAGVYHYDFRKHRLDVLWQRAFTQEETEDMFGYAWGKKASSVIVMTGVFNRTTEKYGERGYRFVLVEAGHIGQNIALVSSAIGVKCCSLGGINEDYFESLIDVDPKKESMVYSIVLGN